MSKKKKHYKQSISGKVRNDAEKHFKQYENNVTRASFIKNYDKFIKFCREQYDCKTKEECAEHIEDYIEYLKEKDHTASTIHTYMAPVGLYHGIPLNVMNLPKRYAAENTRSRKERKHYRSDGDENNSKYSRTVELQRCIGIRRNELKNLRGSDLKVDECGYLCIVVRRGKGGKETYQRILPEDIGTVKSFFDGTENKVFSAQEMNNSIDYHHMRAEQAVRAYNYYLDRIFHIVYATIYFGMRRSEVLGLRWDAIDFENKMLIVKHTVVMYNNKVVAKDSTKTDASNRTYPLSDDMIEFFKWLKAREEEERAVCGKDYIENDYIFKWPNGKTYDPDYISKHFKKLLKKNKLKRIRFHDLRHSCAALLLSEGRELYDVSEWLGHSDVNITAKFYGHLDMNRKKALGNTLGNSIGFKNVV